MKLDDENFGGEYLDLV